MSDVGEGRGHAKVIVCGEHFVLHGAAAVAMALPTVTTSATLQRQQDGVSVQAERPLTDSQVQATSAMAGLAMQAVGLPVACTLRIRSRIPIGRGLGSSAALAVAMVRAAENLADVELSASERLDVCRRMESVVHGTSSGIDPAAAMTEGAVLFCDGHIEKTLTVCRGRGMDAARWVLIDAGNAPPTAHAVACSKAALAAMAPDKAAQLIATVDDASRLAARALAEGRLDLLADALTACGDALDEVDVVDDRMRGIIELARRAGATAVKQTGAGLGGMMLALAPNGRIAETVIRLVSPLARSTRLVALVNPSDDQKSGDSQR